MNPMEMLANTPQAKALKTQLEAALAKLERMELHLATLAQIAYEDEPQRFMQVASKVAAGLKGGSS